MKVACSIGAAVALLLAPVSALAEAPLWGYFVHDADGEFVTGDWPRVDEVSFGSDADNDVVLDGLDAHHATVRVDHDVFRVVPKGEVSVAGAPVEDDLDVQPLTPIHFGTYSIELRLADPNYTDPVPPETPVVDGEPVIDYSNPPQAREAAARASLARRPEFAREGYRFCHDEDFAEGGVVGADFCAIFDESTYEVCPAVKDSCPWDELQVKTVFGRFSSDYGKGGKDGQGKGRRKRKREKITLPAVPPIVAYGVLALIVVILVGWFVKQLMDAGWEKSELELAEDEIDEAMLDLQSLPEARSHVLLKLAERSLARGESEEAAILAHLAILRHLDDEGLARYHPSKTNGDYLRAIRRQKPLAKLFRGVANQTERVRFGDGFVDAALLQTQLADARTLLVPGSELPLVSSVAPTVLILLIGLSTQSCVAHDDPRAFYSHGPAGMAAFVGMLRETGLTPQIKLDALADVPPEIKTIVLRTSSSRTGQFPPEINFDDLLDRGTSIVVIDDLGVAPNFLPGTSTSAPTSETVSAVAMKFPTATYETTCAQRFVSVSKNAWTSDIKLPRGARIDISAKPSKVTVSRDEVKLDSLLVYDDANLEAHQTVGIAIQRTTDTGPSPGCVYVFSDRDLFANASLTRPANARFVGALFSTIAQNDRRVWIIDRLDRWHSGGGGDAMPDDPTKPLRASNLLPLLIQGLVSLALLYVFLGAAFGPLRDTTSHVRKSFVEHVEAIGRQYARCGLPGLNHAAASLARLVVMRNRERVRGGGAGWAVLARELAEKHDLPEEDVRAALRLGIEGTSELGTPKLEDPAPSSERMLRTLSKLLGGRRAELALKPRRTFRRKKRSA